MTVDYDVNQPIYKLIEDRLFGIAGRELMDSSRKQYIITKEVDIVMHVRGHVVAAYK